VLLSRFSFFIGTRFVAGTTPIFAAKRLHRLVTSNRFFFSWPSQPSCHSSFQEENGIMVSLKRTQDTNAPDTSMEERDFFDEKAETKRHTLMCPHCGRKRNTRSPGWSAQEEANPNRADERDRARYAKLRTYMVRRDDLLGCKNIRCANASKSPACNQ